MKWGVTSLCNRSNQKPRSFPRPSFLGILFLFRSWSLGLISNGRSHSLEASRKYESTTITKNVFWLHDSGVVTAGCGPKRSRRKKLLRGKQRFSFNFGSEVWHRETEFCCKTEAGLICRWLSSGDSGRRLIADSRVFRSGNTEIRTFVTIFAMLQINNWFANFVRCRDKVNILSGEQNHRGEIDKTW